MRRLGDKIARKHLAEQAEVPIVPWSGGPVDSVEAARPRRTPRLSRHDQGHRWGRRTRDPARSPRTIDALPSARSEALKAFGDGTVFMECAVAAPGTSRCRSSRTARAERVAVGVRDCTIQRRNQKVVEESPSPALSPESDAAMRAAAVRLSQAAGYQNAGTVEFLFDAEGERFWFMEVNARLQVEHPVTEMTTGLDLVKLQVQIARGEPLVGEPPEVRGHAIEVRLNAEDPENGFAPAPGVIEALRFPTGPGLRVDTGVAEGDTVPHEFDSMVAKVIAWGRNRPEALGRLRRGLAQSATVIRDGTTNKAFLLELLSGPRSQPAPTTWAGSIASSRGGRRAAAPRRGRARTRGHRGLRGGSGRRARAVLRVRGPRAAQRAPRDGRVVELGYGGRAYASACSASARTTTGWRQTGSASSCG